MTSIKDIIPKIVEFAKGKMPDDILHGWPHIERLLEYASRINQEVNANWDIIQCAILLHDTGHKINPIKHNEISAEIAQNYLKSKISQDTLENIKNSILCHSRQYAKTKPVTLRAGIP